MRVVKQLSKVIDQFLTDNLILLEMSWRNHFIPLINCAANDSAETGCISYFTKPDISWLVCILGNLSGKRQVFRHYLEVKPNKSGALLGHPFGCWEKMIAVLVNTHRIDRLYNFSQKTFRCSKAIMISKLIKCSLYSSKLNLHHCCLVKKSRVGSLYKAILYKAHFFNGK